MKIFNQLREFFWPLLEGEPDSEKIEQLLPESINVEEKDLEKVFEIAWKCYEFEEDRRRTIDKIITIYKYY